MKKIKLFALAAFAMLSTNAFAQEISATKVFTFEAADKDAEECTITGFVADLDDEFKTATAIPEFVTHPSYKPGGEAKKYKVTAISDDAFAGEPIQTITFPAAVEEDDYTGISNIGAGAFAGTKIQTLDLSNTIITYVRNFFGTDRAADKKNDVVNVTLKKVILPATATQLKDYAFWGCTKLESIDMTAATGLNVIGVAALAGCPLKALDLSKNKAVTKLVAHVLNDAIGDDKERFTAPTELVTVKLHEAFTALNGNLKGATKLTTVSGHVLVKPNKTEVTAFTLGAKEFEGCTALTTIDTHKITNFAASCFKGCSSLASVNISAATKIEAEAFAGTALTSVTIPANAALTTIGASAFFECASLATITLAQNTDNKTTITTINANAFGYTAIEKFTVPAANTEGITIAGKAFVGCSSLTDFTYAPATITATKAKLIATDAFNRCSNVKFHTTKAFVDDWRATEGEYAEGKKFGDGPSNTTFDYEVSDGKTKFTLTHYKSNANKYYVKWSGKVNGAAKAIKVKKGDAKVYSAYVDADGSVNLTQYAADKGWIYIKQGDVALIITENAELTYEDGTDDKTTSWQTEALTTDEDDVNETVTGLKKNALKYVFKATTRATLESAVAEGWYIYGWVNKSDACGFQKIASGTTINEGVLFAWGKPAAGGRLTINWYDENGNLEAETTAINAIEAAAPQAEGARYNVAGQKVSAAYKGLVIKDGKKYMQK